MTIDTSNPHQLLNRIQAAEFLGVAVATLEGWSYTKRYNLPYVKVGRLVKYKVSDLIIFLENHTVA